LRKDNVPESIPAIDGAGAKSLGKSLLSDLGEGELAKSAGKKNPAARLALGCDPASEAAVSLFGSLFSQALIRNRGQRR